MPKEAISFVDQHSIREFDEAITKVIVDSKSAEPSITVTIVGRVMVAARYTTHESRDGGYLGTGYGLMGRYPVQILILRIKKLQVSGTETR